MHKALTVRFVSSTTSATYYSKGRLRGSASIQSNRASHRAMKHSPSTAQKSVVRPSCIGDDIRAAAARRFDTVGGNGAQKPREARTLHRVHFVLFLMDLLRRTSLSCPDLGPDGPSYSVFFSTKDGMPSPNPFPKLTNSGRFGPRLHRSELSTVVIVHGL